jgi:hypothetical protein
MALARQLSADMLQHNVNAYGKERLANNIINGVGELLGEFHAVKRLCATTFT